MNLDSIVFCRVCQAEIITGVYLNGTYVIRQTNWNAKVKCLEPCIVRRGVYPVSMFIFCFLFDVLLQRKTRLQAHMKGKVGSNIDVSRQGDVEVVQRGGCVAEFRIVLGLRSLVGIKQ